MFNKNKVVICLNDADKTKRLPGIFCLSMDSNVCEGKISLVTVSVTSLMMKFS